MEKYANRGNNSGVDGFQIGDDYIIVWFKEGATKAYTYSYKGRAGRLHVDNMKRLAAAGMGLNSYINRNVKYLYD